MILLLIFVFDPLAVLLLISANQSYRKELEINPPEEKGLPVNVGKTVRSATSNKGVKKIQKNEMVLRYTILKKMMEKVRSILWIKNDR